MPSEPGAILQGERSDHPEAARVATAAQIEAFYHEFYRPLIRRAIRRHDLSLEDARDVVHQAFVVALEKMESEGNAQAWLRQVVDFLAINMKRTSQRRATLLARWQPPEASQKHSLIPIEPGD